MDAIMNQKQKLTDEMMLFDSTGKLVVQQNSIYVSSLSYDTDVLATSSTHSAQWKYHEA